MQARCCMQVLPIIHRAAMAPLHHRHTAASSRAAAGRLLAVAVAVLLSFSGVSSDDGDNALCPAGFAASPANDVVVLLDGSVEVSAADFAKAKEFIMDLGATLFAAGDNRVAAVEFSTFACPVARQCFGFQSSAPGLSEGAAGMIRSQGVADVGRALE